MSFNFYGGAPSTPPSTTFKSSRDSGLDSSSCSFDSYSSSSTSTKVKNELKVDHCFDLSLLRKINAMYGSQEMENESLFMSSIHYGIKLQKALSLTSFDKENDDINSKSLRSNSTKTYRNEMDSDFEDDDQGIIDDPRVDEAIHVLDEVIEDFEEDNFSYLDLQRDCRYGSKESLYEC